MQVILLERVAKLGQMGDVVDVKPGFARNFLVPQGKALTASDRNLRAFENRRSQLEARNLETRQEAEEFSSRLEGARFVVIRSASDTGALYGSVTSRDAAETASAEGFSLDRRQIVLQRPIKELGLHKVTVVLHPEVSAEIELNVARSPEEAELQAAGKSVRDTEAEADAEADFEMSELFDDLGAAVEGDSDLIQVPEGDSLDGSPTVPSDAFVEIVSRAPDAPESGAESAPAPETSAADDSAASEGASAAPDPVTPAGDAELEPGNEDGAEDKRTA